MLYCSGIISGKGGGNTETERKGFWGLVERLGIPVGPHLWLVLFWPGYVIVFFLVERLAVFDSYRVMYCPADDLIPFCEYFILPYIGWYLYLAWGSIHLLRRDIAAFRRMIWFMLLSFGAAFIAFLVWPSCQELRPEVFPRENLCTWLVRRIYAADTSTNVSPSMHVLGVLGVVGAVWNAEGCRSLRTRLPVSLIGLLICAATLFVKQHSLVDILTALPVSLAAGFLCFGLDLPNRLRKGKEK